MHLGYEGKIRKPQSIGMLCVSLAAGATSDSLPDSLQQALTGGWPCPCRAPFQVDNQPCTCHEGLQHRHRQSLARTLMPISGPLYAQQLLQGCQWHGVHSLSFLLPVRRLRIRPVGFRHVQCLGSAIFCLRCVMGWLGVIPGGQTPNAVLLRAQGARVLEALME
jgi:hypothetical protein